MPERNEAHADIVDLIVQRWSPRAFDESAIPQDKLDVIFEAAGWAPSAYNVQPWTFLYSHRGDENWDRFLSLLVEFNQSWAKDASVLVFVVSDKFMRNEDGSKKGENHTHSFDAGSAWAMLALQAQAMGYHTHGMSGVDFDAAARELGVPDDHRIEAAIAIGTQTSKDKLPPQLQEREVKSGRKPVAEIARAGNFS